MTKPLGRDLGLPFPGEAGLHNAITDVPGVGDTVMGANPSDYDPIFDVSGNVMDTATLDAILTDLPQPPYTAIADLSANPGSGGVNTGLAQPNWIIIT